MCEAEAISKVVVPLLSAVAAIASAFAACNANKISKALQRLQKNSILNQREIELLSRALELLKVYDVWCKPDGAGNDVNFHDSKESNYSSRDDAWTQIPRDIKFLIIQLSSHSSRLELLLSEWESGFINKAGDSYHLNDKLVTAKISSLRDILSGGL